MKGVGAALALVAVAAACASAPTSPATAQAPDREHPRAESVHSDTCAANGCTKPASAAPEQPAKDAHPRPPPYVAIPIEDPSGRALRNFHNALRAAQQKRGQARILFYGASHTAADIYTEVIRSRLQERFGEAGMGFAVPARPIPHYRNSGILFENSTGWTGVHVMASAPASDSYGLAGMYVTTSGRRPAHSAFSTRGRGALTGYASKVELYYWKQPHGGHFRLIIDNRSHEIDTGSKKHGAGYQAFKVQDGPHHFEIATRGDGPVRLFGITLERTVPGVILDTLGVPGSRARDQLLWEDRLYREQLARRHPDLVALAYGTNESGDDDQPIAEYASELRRVVERVRRTVPHASCLLIGPSDRPRSNEDGVYTDRPRTAQIVATQRQVAAEYGCGFFDLVSFMGGPLSMLNWCSEDPPFGASDHVHFTARGYEALGNMLYNALLAGFDADTGPRVPVSMGLGPRPATRPGELDPARGDPDSTTQGGLPAAGRRTRAGRP